MSANKKVLIIILIIFLAFTTAAATAASANSGNDLNFTILHTNDEHSSLIPHSPAVDYNPDFKDPAADQTVGGFARLAAAVKNIRRQKAAAGEETLLLSAGDFLGGSPFSWLTYRNEAAELKLMQDLGYQAAVIGNHEFDYGPDMLAEYLKEASYPEAHQELSVLAANLNPEANSSFAEDNLYQNKKIVELKNGLEIGIFGIQGEKSVSLIKDQGDLKFKDSFETAAEMTAELQKEADIIIALTHSGLSDDLRLARGIPEIDLIIGGHSHTVLEKPVTVGDTIVAQAGSKLEYLGKLELAYDRAQKKLSLLNSDSALIKIDSQIESDSEFKELVDNYRKKFNQLISDISDYDQHLETVIKSDFVIESGPAFSETPAGNFITDAMRLQTEAVLGEEVDLAVKTNGSIRKDIVPGKNGEITFYELAETVGLGKGRDDYPGYPVITAFLSGRELKELLEVAVLVEEFMGNSSFLQFSGLRYQYDPNQAVLTTLPFSGQPIPSMDAVAEAKLYNGDGVQDKDGDSYREIYDDQLYRIVTDSYLLDYLPLLNETLPQVNIIPKNAEGEVLLPENKREFKVYQAEDRELKIWETVIDFAAEQQNKEGEAEVPDYYRKPADRIQQVKMEERPDFTIQASSLHSFQKDRMAAKEGLKFDTAEGYKFSLNYDLTELSSLTLDYNYLKTAAEQKDYFEEIELKGAGLNYSYNLSRLLKAAGYDFKFDLKPRLGAAYYQGEYNLDSQIYDADNFALNIGLNAEKKLSGDFKVVGNLNYRLLKLDFESRSRQNDLSKNMNGLELGIGLLYQF